jgi:DNA mismatch endonuclease (patch repair protein)
MVISVGDRVDKLTRSRMMRSIRAVDTRPEKLVRSALHGAGFRFRLHSRKLPGSPDLVLKKFKALIFVHGCFWHRHEGCAASTTPSSNAEFWTKKFKSNVSRDLKNKEQAAKLGWRIATVWECRLKKMSREEIAQKLGAWLRSKDLFFELG